MKKNEEDRMKKILIIAILFLFIAPIFAQREKSNYRRGRSKRVESKETDPNSVRSNPSKQPKSKKTLEDRVDELEEKVVQLERMIVILKDDNRILESRFQELKYSNSEKEKARRREERRKKNMTEEEKDMASGIYPLLPRSKYEEK